MSEGDAAHLEAYRKRVQALEELLDVEMAEVTRLREARNLFGHLLSRIVDHWENPLGHVNEFIANDIEQAKRALAEGSDVLPTQREH